MRCASTRRCRPPSACRRTSCVRTRATRQIRMRISDASSQYHSMQLYGTKRTGDFQFTVSYTLGRVLTDASGNGDNDSADGADDLDFFYGPASFDRRHAFVNTLTYRVPWLRDRGGFLEALARRLGSQQQVPLPVGPVLHARRATRRSATGAPSTSAARSTSMATSSSGSTRPRSPTRQRIGAARRRSDRSRGRRSSRWTCRSARTSVRRALPPDADLRHLQPVQHGELRQLPTRAWTPTTPRSAR